MTQNEKQIEYEYFLEFITIINKEKKEYNKKNNKLNKQSTFDCIGDFKEYIITRGADYKLYIYNKNYEKIKELENSNDSAYFVVEKENILKKKDDILLCYRNNVKNIKFDIKNRKFDINDNFISKNMIFIIEYMSNEFYIGLKNEVIFLKNIKEKIIPQKKILVFNKKIFIKSIIRLSDEKIVIFKSNKVISYGEDRLIFFNYFTKNEISLNIKREYSFVLTVNGLTEMHNDNDNNIDIKDKKSNNKQKIILCACKKYINNQKNGILIICFDNDSINNANNSNKSKYRFYDTGNYEVYCFCPLLINKNNTNNILDENPQKKMTNYFLVGGFDLKRNKGMIKLYKVNYGKTFNNTKIEYIQNLKFKDNNIKFKGPISCINQTIYDGKILINCWDGNVYLLEKPQIEKYLEYDENIKNILNKYK